MRAALLVLIVAAIVSIGAIATGFLKINRTRGGEPPEVSATFNGSSAKGGQAPTFDVETGSVKVGTRETIIKTPTLQMRRAGENATENAPSGATSNDAM